MCGVKAGHIAGQPHRAALRRKRQGRSSSRPRSVQHCSPVCRRPRSAVTGTSAGSLFARSPAGPDRRIGGSERRPGTPTESDWLSPLSPPLASTVNQAADAVRLRVPDGRPARKRWPRRSPPWPSRCSSLPSSSFRFSAEPKVIGMASSAMPGLDELAAARWKSSRGSRTQARRRLTPSAAGPRFVTVGMRGSTAGEARPGEHRGRAAQRLHCFRTEAARASIGRMSTIPAARDGAAPLRATSDSSGNAAVSDVASPEQIHKQGMVRLAAIIAEWQKARDTLLRGG